MKKICILTISLLFTCLLNQAQTIIEVSGDIPEDVVWDADIIKVIDDVEVRLGSTITITPGSKLEFQGHYTILFTNGVLNAVGTREDSIIFTARFPAEGWFGLYFDEIEEGDTSKISYCLFEYGQARGESAFNNGGAIHCDYYYNNLLIENSLFRNNMADWGGAAISTAIADIRIINCVFEKNVANFGGGAIKCSSSAPSIINCLFYNNTAGGTGGALFATGSVFPYINNCTFVNNYAGYGGGCTFDCDAIVKNCIFWGNHAENGHEISIKDHIGGDSEPQFYYCDIQGSVDDFYIHYDSDYKFDYHSAENMDLDPMFIDAYSNEFCIQWTSPCVNAGTEYTAGLDLPDVDLAGNPRIFDDRVDIGGYESQPGFSVNENHERVSFKVFPNPSSGLINIKLNLDQKYQVIITDLSGNILLKGDYQNNNSKYDLSSFEPGCYLIKITDGNHSDCYSEKIIIY